MSHARQAIRDAVVELLKDATTSAGDNVYPNRETRLWESELPAILVSTKDESAQSRDISGRQSIRTLQIVIECKVMASESVDNDLDDLVDQVETCLSENPGLSGTSLSETYIGTEVRLDAESDTEKGVAALTYEIKYIK